MVEKLEKDLKVGDFLDIKFPHTSKLETLKEYLKRAEILGSYTFHCKIKKIVEVGPEEWEKIINSFMDRRPRMWENIGGISLPEKFLYHLEGLGKFSDEYFRVLRKYGERNIVLLKNTATKEAIAINTEGYEYARYVGWPKV